MVNQAVMFHHFHGDEHPVGQGSLSKEQFEELIRYVIDHYAVLSPREFIAKTRLGTIEKQEICLTFDDGLRCQLDIAEPIMRKYQLTAFFFVYSGVFVGGNEQLESYRDFRSTQFPSMDAFYKDFFLQLARKLPSRLQEYERTYPDNHLIDYLFYTEMDRRFRFVRDFVLTSREYDHLMETMMEEADYCLLDAARRLWLRWEDLKYLDEAGHEIGLHSHSHPTRFDQLSYKEQEEEYTRNKQLLESHLGERIISMSHPCGLYNEDTLSILEDLNIQIGFRCDQFRESANPLEISRLDHSDLVRMMG
jgi:peptidoglycan/xylan/chitin deacetylase (PgdA/CDA1 family)